MFRAIPSRFKMALLNRFSSFLSRFDSQLVVNGERVKHEINQWIDQRVTLVRTEVAKMKASFGGNRPVNGKRAGNDQTFDDDPKVVTVEVELFMQQQANLLRDGVDRNQPSTSSGRKRKSTNQTGNKQKKTRTTGTSGTNQHICKFSGCGKSFHSDSKLAEHERIHLNIKPFSCTWVNCGFSSEQRANVVQHIRMKHFRLPQTLKEQRRLNIMDDRDPEQFVQVDDELVHRRLE